MPHRLGRSWSPDRENHIWSDILTTGSEGTALTLAVVNQHPSVVKFILRYASTRVVRKSRLLYKAVENGDLVTLDVLPRHADLNPLDYPLWEAVAAGRNAEQILRLLLAMGADVRARNSSNETIFFHVARRGLSEACRVLLEVRPSSWPATTKESKLSKFVRLLVEHGADLHREKTNGAAPLHMAVRNGHEGVVTLLLDRGARFDFGSDMSAAVLVSSLQSGHQSIVDVFVRRALDQEEGTWLRNSIFLARYGQDHSILYFFLKGGISLEPCDMMLCEAAKTGHGDVVNLLLDRAWDMNSSVPGFGTSLYGAVQENRRNTKAAANIYE